MSAEPLERTAYVRKAEHVPDRAEQAQNHVVTERQLERGHLAGVYSAHWQLRLRDAHECRIQIQTIDLEPVIGNEQAGVFPRPTRDIENASRARCQIPDESRHLRSFRRIILELRVNQVVELCRCGEHWVSVECVCRVWCVVRSLWGVAGGVQGTGCESLPRYRVPLTHQSPHTTHHSRHTTHPSYAAGS